jgi:hypothetical protein
MIDWNLFELMLLNCFDDQERVELGARGNVGANHADKYNDSIESTTDDRNTVPCRECPEGMEW